MSFSMHYDQHIIKQPKVIVAMSSTSAEYKLSEELLSPVEIEKYWLAREHERTEKERTYE